MTKYRPKLTLLFLILTLLGLYYLRDTAVKSRSKTILITQFYTEDYLEGVITLFFSARKNGYLGDAAVFILEDQQLSQNAKLLLESHTIDIYRVRRIDYAIKPWGRFQDQFTKLRIFELIEYDRVLYLDADCLVVGSLEPLLSISSYFPIAAVLDLRDGRVGNTFNAGMMSVHPSLKMFEKIFSRINDTDSYQHDEAEQGLLNAMYNHQVLLLPRQFNLMVDFFYLDNLRGTWDSVYETASILHYTLRKPFDYSGENDSVLQLWTRYRDEAFSLKN